MRKWVRKGVMKQVRTFEARRKRAEKQLKAWGYTPRAAQILSAILCNLTEEPDHRRQEALGLFTKIAEGE